MWQVPRANSFRHAPFPNASSVRKRRFGKGVSSRISLGCSFSVSEAKRNVPGNTRHVPPKTPFLKLLFRTPEKTHNIPVCGPKPPKLLSHFCATLNFSGFGFLWQVPTTTTQGPGVPRPELMCGGRPKGPRRTQKTSPYWKDHCGQKDNQSLTPVGALCFGHFLGDPRGHRQLKLQGEPLYLKAFATIKRAIGPLTGGSVPLTGVF